MGRSGATTRNLIPEEKMIPKGPHKEQIMKLCRIVLKYGPQSSRVLTDHVGEMYRMDVTMRTLSQWLSHDKRFQRHAYQGQPTAKYILWCLTSLCLHKERTLSLRHHNATETDSRSG